MSVITEAEVPAPGTDEAVRRGCICPRPKGGVDPDRYSTRRECPVHGWCKVKTGEVD